MRGSGDWAGLGGQILDTFVDSGGSEARSSRHSSNVGAGAEAQELRLQGSVGVSLRFWAPPKYQRLKTKD